MHVIGRVLSLLTGSEKEPVTKACNHEYELKVWKANNGQITCYWSAPDT